MLYEDLCQKESLVSYIPLYQISRDHLEIFFGCIRAFGRQNNNPTVKQFKAAFKRLLTRAQVKGATTGNCIALEYIPILNASSKSEDIINVTSSNSRMIDYEINYDNYTNQVLVAHDHSYMFIRDSTYLSEYCQEIIIYIAGFIVRHLMKTIICEICIHSLTADNKTGELIYLKNRESLIYPSESVIKICTENEKVIRLFCMKKLLDILYERK